MFGFRLIRDNEVGIVTKNMFGEKMRPGQIIATNGEIGIQAETLRPGLYWRMPIIWSIDKVRVTTIAPGEVGTIASIDGKPLPAGRLLGDEVECNVYQDAKAFLENGGYKGAQIGILKPGTYRINTSLFTVMKKAVTNIKKGQVGVAIAKDGTPLPSGLIVAPAPTQDCGHFQNGMEFIRNSGFRGPQLETLQPGEYYINPDLFEVATDNIATIPPGYVAVMISNVGTELETNVPAPHITTDPDLRQPPNEPGETPLITDKTQRGILADAVAPGSYNLNRYAYRTELVPTSAITIDWASNAGGRETAIQAVETHGNEKSVEFFRFSQLKVTAKDGFQLEVDVRLIIRIPPANAPSVIARFGTVNNLIEQVAHPLIDSSFRNDAGNKEAMDFVHSRKELQEQALLHAREEFSKYHVEVQGLLIAYIKVDQSLLDTQTKKQIAIQQKKQYVEEANAQQERINVMEQTARADKQAEVVAALLKVNIAENNAQATIKESEGTKQAIIMKAEGEAFAAKEVGKGIAEGYKAQVAEIGAENLTALNIFEKIATGKIKVMPEILVTSNGNGNNSADAVMNLLGATLATKLAENKPAQQETQ